MVKWLSRRLRGWFGSRMKQGGKTYVVEHDDAMRGKAAMDHVERRTRRAIQSLLENESLTSNLDDEAAQALLAWGMDCVKLITPSTANLDESQAEEAIYPRLRATRRLMQRVNRWVAQQQDLDESQRNEFLDQVLEQAAIIYGQGFAVPESTRCRTFVTRLAFSPDPMQMIADLRTLIEN